MDGAGGERSIRVQSRSFDIALHVENVFDSTWREAQFEETYRVAPGAPVETGIKYTPGTPFAATVRVALSWR